MYIFRPWIVVDLIDHFYLQTRSLSETVKTLKGQMLDLQAQVTQLSQQLNEERRSRLSLAATVKRNITLIDGSSA